MNRRPGNKKQTNPLNTKRSLTDVKKSLEENVSDRFEQWKEVDITLETKKNQLKSLNEKLKSAESIPLTRVEKADIRVMVEDLELDIERIERSNNQVDYMACLVNVMKKVDNAEFEDDAEEAAEEDVKVNMTGPIKTRTKKKNRHRDDAGSVMMRSIFNVVGTKSDQPQHKKSKSRGCKMLAQMLHEIPLDQAEVEYCTTCPGKVALEYCEKPPSLCCPTCGSSRYAIDTSSSSVHDKDSAVHIPFTYRPKQHFYQWIKRVTGKLKCAIPTDIVDAVSLKLNNMRIFDVNKVTWDMVNEILHDLAKHVDKKFSDYYQHVYQITNIIRGAPVLVLTDTQEQELLNLFDVIYISWEKHKQVNRDNFLSNAFVLQLCFHILDYPEKIVSMFNILKGPDNIKEYDRISNLICKDLGKSPVKLAAFADAKIGKGSNILEKLSGAVSKQLSLPRTVPHPVPRPVPQPSAKKQRVGV